MSLEPGESWGHPGVLGPEGVVVSTDAGARRILEAARRTDVVPPDIGLVGGDLCRGLGGRGDVKRITAGPGTVVLVDAGRVEFDGQTHWFVAHLACHRIAWLGHAVAVMNTEWLGPWRLAPRAHPGDGVLDLVRGSLPLRELWQARARLPTGDHLPHPRLHVARFTTTTLELPRPSAVRLDGEVVGRTRTLRVSVEPQALRVVV